MRAVVVLAAFAAGAACTTFSASPVRDGGTAGADAGADTGGDADADLSCTRVPVVIDSP